MLKSGRIAFLSLLLAHAVDASAQRTSPEVKSAAPSSVTRTMPQPDSAAAMRRLLAEVASGKPNYDLLAPAMAATLRERLPTYQQELLALGLVKSVTFALATPDGADIFDVRLANGSLKCMIRLDPQGKVLVADCREAALPPL